MSSIEQNGDGGEIDGGKEVAGGLIIACGDGTELLEFGEEVLDQMAPHVSHTSNVGNLRRLDAVPSIERVIASKGAGVQATTEAFEMTAWSLALASGAVR